MPFVVRHSRAVSVPDVLGAASWRRSEQPAENERPRRHSDTPAPTTTKGGAPSSRGLADRSETILNLRSWRGDKVELPPTQPPSPRQWRPLKKATLPKDLQVEYDKSKAATDRVVGWLQKTTDYRGITDIRKVQSYMWDKMEGLLRQLVHQNKAHLPDSVLEDWEFTLDTRGVISKYYADHDTDKEDQAHHLWFENR